MSNYKKYVWTHDTYSIFYTDFGQIITWYSGLNPYLTPRELFEVSRKFIKGIHGSDARRITDFEDIPADEYYKGYPWSIDTLNTNGEPIDAQKLIDDEVKKFNNDYSELYKLYDYYYNDRKKLKEFISKNKKDPYSFMFSYFLDHGATIKPEFINDNKIVKSTKKNDKTKMISDIKSMLSDHKKSKKSQMIKDIDDLIKSVNETKPKMRKSLDKSIKANDLIHKIEGKLKKKKAIRMSLDKFF
jgi:hypothetical protein